MLIAPFLMFLCFCRVVNCHSDERIGASVVEIPLAFIGLLFSINPLIDIGIWFFSFAVLFQLITLPVEFDASRRALAMVEDYGFLGAEETQMFKKVLSAAAMTYVAAAATAVVQLLRLMALRGRRN